MQPEFHPQYIVDENKTPKAVILTIEEWTRILEELEDSADARDYRKAKAAAQESIPFEQAMKEIDEGLVN